MRLAEAAVRGVVHVRPGPAPVNGRQITSPYPGRWPIDLSHVLGVTAYIDARTYAEHVSLARLLDAPSYPEAVLAAVGVR